MTATTALTQDSLGAFDLIATPVWIVPIGGQDPGYANDAARAFRSANRHDALCGPPDLGLRLQAAPGDPILWDMGSRDGPVAVRSRWVSLDGAPCILSAVEPAHPSRPPTPEGRIGDALGAFPGRVAILSAADQRIIGVTQDYATRVGLSGDALVGHRLSDLFPDDGPCAWTGAASRLTQSLQNVLRTGATDVAGVLAYPTRTASGALTPRDVPVVNKPVAGQGGAVTAIVHVITEFGATVADPAHAAGSRTERPLARAGLLAASVSDLRQGDRRPGIAESLPWSVQTARAHEEPDGFLPSLEQAIDHDVAHHRPRGAEPFAACLETGTPFEERFRLVTAKGNMIRVATTGEAVRDKDGHIVAVEGAIRDVSDLLLERDRSRAQYRRLRQTLDHISDGFYLLDRDWKVVFLNPEAERLLHRPRDSLLGRSFWQEFPDTVGSDFERSCRKAMEQGCHVRFDARAPRLQAWFSVNAHPTPEGLAVYFRDVTAARDRDEKLALLAAAVARQNDILLITDAAPVDGPDGPRIVYVNEAFTRLTGYSPAEVLGRTPRLLQGPRTQRDELARIRAALERWEPVRAELINYTRSGEEFWVELDIVPLSTEEGGRVTHWVSIQRDITARRQAEAALRASEDRFRLVARATGNAIWDWDIPGNRHWWSDGLTEQFGHPSAPADAIASVWEDNLHPEDRDRVLAAQTDLLEGKLPALHETYRFRCADGSWASVEDHAFVIRDAEGRAIRLLGSMNNVTERLLLEDRLRHAQKLEAVGQMTGGIAHDFNNLLTIILGNSEALEDALADDATLRAQIALITVAADRGAELTRRLLAFSRRQPLEARSIDIDVLLSDMAPLLRRTLGEDVRVDIVPTPGLWPTEVDAGQLEAAILNLALNARDAMDAGGSLTIETANAPLDSDYAATEVELEAGNYVVVVVTDTGHGMTHDTIARAFEPFFTTKEAGKGSGLGLSMVFGFVKQSGGHVRIYSEPGEGTAVKLYFPRAALPATETRPKPAARHAVGGTETILVVEDEALVRDHVVAQLRALGYRVLAAKDGPDALALLAEGGAVDLLFTDVVMPGGMGGRALAERASLLRPGLKVLFTSGYTENSIMHQGRLPPGVDLLNKPYRRDALAAKLRKVLDGD